MVHTTCLVCFISTVNGCSKKKGKCLGRCGASSGHITKLKQSIFFRYLWSKTFVVTTIERLKAVCSFDAKEPRKAIFWQCLLAFFADKNVANVSKYK